MPDRTGKLHYFLDSGVLGVLVEDGKVGHRRSNLVVVRL